MNKMILACLMCLLSIHGFAIEFYKPGDTLWVWAKDGLNIRAEPSVHAKSIGKAENGAPVVTLSYQNEDFPYGLEVIKQRTYEMKGNDKVECPNFELTGYWAKIKYKGVEGYVFDAYLSKLPTFIGHQNEINTKDDFHVMSLKKQAKVLKQIGENKYDETDQKFVRYIFDTGNMIQLWGGSGYWGKEMFFPNSLSITEGYLIYAHTMKSESDILLEKRGDYLKFDIETGFLIIQKVGPFLVIYEEHAC